MLRDNECDSMHYRLETANSESAKNVMALDRHPLLVSKMIKEFYDLDL